MNKEAATQCNINTVCYDSCDEADDYAWKDKVPESSLKDFMESRMEDCGSLQSLTISNNGAMADSDVAAVVAMLPRMPGLRELSFIDCKAPGTAQLLALLDAGAKYCSGLEEFRFNGYCDPDLPWGREGFGLTDRSLMAMADFIQQRPGAIWPDLKVLELTNCRFGFNEGRVMADGYNAIRACAGKVWPKLGSKLILDDMQDLERAARNEYEINEARGIDDDFD